MCAHIRHDASPLHAVPVVQGVPQPPRLHAGKNDAEVGQRRRRHPAQIHFLKDVPDFVGPAADMQHRNVCSVSGSRGGLKRPQQHAACLCLKLHEARKLRSVMKGEFTAALRTTTRRQRNARDVQCPVLCTLCR